MAAVVGRIRSSARIARRALREWTRKSTQHRRVFKVLEIQSKIEDIHIADTDVDTLLLLRAEGNPIIAVVAMPESGQADASQEVTTVGCSPGDLILLHENLHSGLVVP